MWSRKFNLVGILILVLALAAVLVPVSIALAGPAGTGKSHAKPPTNITADFTFQDDGTTLTINGKAKGMEPGHDYTSLIYGVGSEVNGIHACESGGTLGLMRVGSWTVNPDGTGELQGQPVALSGVRLSEIGTISVRGGSRRAPTGPPGTPVILCGKVTR